MNITMPGTGNALVNRVNVNFTNLGVDKFTNFDLV